MENNKKEMFSYTYSAKEQDEIKAIRMKYTPQEVTEDKMQKLRRLDSAVTQKATTVSLIIGIIGILITGLGMSLIMTDIGAVLGTISSMIVGISIGIVGIIMVSAAYPIYNYKLKKEREKIAPEILRLTEELMR